MKLIVRTKDNEVQHWETDSKSFKEARTLIIDSLKPQEPQVILALVEPGNAYDL